MIRTETEVKRVQIYRRGAEIARSGQVQLEAGTNRILIGGLSQTADVNTMRVLFPAGISLSDIRYVNKATEEEQPESKKITEKIDALKKKIEIRQLQAELWKTNGNFSRRSTQQIDEVRTYIDELEEKLDSLNADIAGMNKEIEALERQLNEEVRQENLPVISAEVTAEKAGTYPLELRYHEDSAYWDPVYELHTDARSPVTMKVRARIFQNTREDWKGVEVSLLTGNPSAHADLPKPDAVFAGLQPERIVSKKFTSARMMSVGAAAPMNEMMDMEATASLELAETEEAAVNTEETMTEYELPYARDIISGGDGALADLQSFTLDAEYCISAVPYKDSRAWLSAKMKTGDLPAMISGVTGIYLNGIYAGSVHIRPDLTKETFEISLGREEAVQTSRIERPKKISESKLKGQKYADHACELRISNRRDKEITVEVFDQIPVSSDKSVTVEVREISGGTRDEKTGIVSWKLDLQPKETKVLQTAYRLGWPREKQIELTRRPVSSVRYCPACGSEVPPRLRFCPECGSPVSG